MKRSAAWKALERQTAEALHGRRVLRRWDLFESATDVIVEDFPSFAIDAKYRQKWGHHKFVKDIARKYGAERPIPILITKGAKEVGACVTLPLDAFGELLDAVRVGRADTSDKGATTR